MNLYHFAKKEINLEQRSYQVSKDSIKPDGLWVSDESEYGWSKWCKAEEFALEKLILKYKVELDEKNLLILNSLEKLDEFNKDYKIAFATIDWQRVKDQFSGIIISPYQWDRRLDFMWYYGWDCASGCIWDLSIIKKFEKVSLTELSQETYSDKRRLYL